MAREDAFKTRMDSYVLAAMDLGLSLLCPVSTSSGHLPSLWEIISTSRWLELQTLETPLESADTALPFQPCMVDVTILR